MLGSPCAEELGVAACGGREAVIAGVEDLDKKGGGPLDGSPCTDSGCCVLDPEDDSPAEGMSPASESSSDPVMSPVGEHIKCPSPCPVSHPVFTKFVLVSSTTSTALDDMLVEAGDNIC
jgi:hypothetical protein